MTTSPYKDIVICLAIAFLTGVLAKGCIHGWWL